MCTALRLYLKTLRRESETVGCLALSGARMGLTKGSGFFMLQAEADRQGQISCAFPYSHSVNSLNPSCRIQKTSFPVAPPDIFPNLLNCGIVFSLPASNSAPFLLSHPIGHSCESGWKEHWFSLQRLSGLPRHCI